MFLLSANPPEKPAQDSGPKRGKNHAAPQKRPEVLEQCPMETLWPLVAGVLLQGGCFRLWPRGVSMLPLLREGRDSVLLRRCDKVRNGDIVLAKNEKGVYILHRVVRQKNGLFILRGDSHAANDTESVRREDLLATVVRIFRGDRPLSRFRAALLRAASPVYRMSAALRRRLKKR